MQSKRGGLVKLKILESLDLVPEVKTIRIERPTNFHFRPGQFILISIPIKEELKKRAYSIASSPTEEDYLEISVKNVKTGLVSPIICSKKPGEFLEVKGPYGMFFLDESHMDNIVLIAGGTGITPMRSIVKYIVDRQLEHVRVSLFEGARCPKELLYREEFEKIHQTHHNIGIYFTVDNCRDEPWPWHQGHITKEFIQECAHEIIGPIFYIAGPPRMIENLLHDLEEAGVPTGNIHTDRW